MVEKEMLGQSDLFQDLDSDELEMLLDIGMEKYYLGNEVIFMEGDEGDALYLILEGTVRVQRGESGPDDSAGSLEVLAILRPGNIFGEIALMDREKRSATVEANESLRVFEIKRKDFEELISLNKDFAIKCYKNFIRVLCSRLRSTNESLSFSRQILENIMAKEKESRKSSIAEK